MKPTERTIEVETLTRVEGEGGLTVRLRDGRVDEVQLRIYEPPRLFESLLRGRPLEDVPDVTARICGICPVAYQMTSVHALEAALGVRISPEIRRLRRLLYCAEWIESHALHVHLLHAPDFFGCDSGIDLAKRFPEEVRRGLRLKKHGNQLLETLGGRAIHPINVAVGGFYRAPTRDELGRLVGDFQWGLQAAVDTARWVATLPLPDFRQQYEFVALSHPDEYPFNEGRVVSTGGIDVSVDEYEGRFEERQVPHSTALHSVRLPEATPYHVGPLARLAINRDRLAPTARRLADELNFPARCDNPFQSITARAIETVHAYEEALTILQSYDPPRPARIPYVARAGEGRAATEAPRGLIYHRYQVDADGRIALAKIVPPTSQNQGQMEADLREFVPSVLQLENSAAAAACERVLRNYDPCISCSTHYLRLTIESR